MRSVSLWMVTWALTVSGSDPIFLVCTRHMLASLSSQCGQPAVLVTALISPSATSVFALHAPNDLIQQIIPYPVLTCLPWSVRPRRVNQGRGAGARSASRRGAEARCSSTSGGVPFEHHARSFSHTWHASHNFWLEFPVSASSILFHNNVCENHCIIALGFHALHVFDSFGIRAAVDCCARR